jgi:hypothetical protein
MLALMVTLLIVLAALGATGWFFWHRRALPYEELARVKKAKTSKSSEFPEHGAGKIVGKVRSPSEPLSSPFSRRPCVYYSVIIEEIVTFMTDDGQAATWVERAGETTSKDFLVDDGHGRVKVETSSVTILATAEAEPNNILLRNPTTSMVEFLKRVDFYPIPISVGRLRCREFCLVEGERVAVHGLAERDSNSEELVFRGSRVTVSDNLRVL